MSIDLGRRLIASGAVPPDEVEAALFLSVVRGVPFARVLIDRGAISERGLEEELERVGGLGLRQVAGASDLVARLPRAMCRRLSAVPTRIDPSTGAIDIAAADPLDPHLAIEFGFHLGAPIRVLRAPIAAIEEEIRRLELHEQEAPGVERMRYRRATPPFPHGAPQSTIPPPDEAPIPLVKRLPAIPLPHELEAADGRPSEPRLAERAAEPRPADPRLPPPRPSDPRPPDPPIPAEDMVLPLSARGVPVAPRAPILRDPPPEFPSVSFPSEPPPSAIDTGGPAVAPLRVDRKTPPYGTPALAPPAPPKDFSAEPSRYTSRRTIRPVYAGAAADEGPIETPIPPPPAPPPPADLEPVAAAPADPPAAAEPEAPAPQAAPAKLGAGGPSRDGGAVLAGLRSAESRDDVVRLALRGMRLAAKRLAVFAVRREGFRGWACSVDFGDPDVFKDLTIPHDLPSILATAAATGTYLGRIPPTAAHESLLRVMETSSADVAAVAVRVMGKPAMVLLADDLDDTMLGTRWLGELAQAVGDALARLLGK